MKANGLYGVNFKTKSCQSVQTVGAGTQSRTEIRMSCPPVLSLCSFNLFWYVEGSL